MKVLLICISILVFSFSYSQKANYREVAKKFMTKIEKPQPQHIENDEQLLVAYDEQLDNYYIYTLDMLRSIIYYDLVNEYHSLTTSVQDIDTTSGVAYDDVSFNGEYYEDADGYVYGQESDVEKETNNEFLAMAAGISANYKLDIKKAINIVFLYKQIKQSKLSLRKKGILIHKTLVKNEINF